MRQTKTLPPTSVVPNTTGLCRLSSVPAGSWPFPTLSLQSLRRCLDPYPVAPLRCVCSLLPKGLRPHLRRHKFGTPNYPDNATSTGLHIFRGCSHSLMFRLPRSLDPQVAPTAEAQSLQGSRAVYTTHSPVGYLPRDVASLRIRHERLIRLDSHQQDCSLVGCSDVPVTCVLNPHFQRARCSRQPLIDLYRSSCLFAVLNNHFQISVLKLL